MIRGAYKFRAVITTFEMILGGCPELNAIEWRCVIIDEAHRLKNKNCKLLEGFKLMNLVCKTTSLERGREHFLCETLLILIPPSLRNTRSC